MWRSTPPFPRLRLHTRSFRSCIIPTGTTPTKTPGQLNFRSSRPSKARSQTLRNDKKYNRQSRRAAQNAERERRRAAEAPPNGERDHVQERETAPPPPPARARCRASNVANQANADPPPSYRASGHPATKAVMQRHMETINRLKSAGKALQQDVDNLITLFDVYGTLPLNPRGFWREKIGMLWIQ